MMCLTSILDPQLPKMSPTPGSGSRSDLAYFDLLPNETTLEIIMFFVKLLRNFLDYFCIW